MKVVIFCGGLGTRLREYSENIPKPLVPIGYRPILWHVMMYYSHFGHKDFILCLGYKADMIKEYFLKYNEYTTNDFILSEGGKKIKLLNSDAHDWSITFVDTGVHSNIGKRLKLVQPFLEGEKMFLANYSDGLSDMPLNAEIEYFKKSGKTACFMCARPSQTFHLVKLQDEMLVNEIQYVRNADIWINAGFYVFRSEIFDYINLGEEMVEEPFHRLIKKKELIAYKYDNFWAMDTFKEQQELSDMYTQGKALWEVWKRAK